MYLCDDGHREICYESVRQSSDCPLCAARKEIDEHERDNEELREKIESLKDEIVDLKDELKSAMVE